MDIWVREQSREAPEVTLDFGQDYRGWWYPTPVLLPGKSHGWRNLEGCSPWGLEELDTTEQLHFHFSLSCIGEGNGNPLQCSCLENPRDKGAWWAAIYEVAQSRTWLKQLSSKAIYGASWWLKGKESACQCRFYRGEFDLWVGKIPWRRKWQSTPVFLPGKSHGQRILEDYSPWGYRRVKHDLATKQQQYIIRQLMSLPPLATSFKQSFVHISQYFFKTVYQKASY